MTLRPLGTRGREGGRGEKKKKITITVTKNGQRQIGIDGMKMDGRER